MEKVKKKKKKKLLPEKHRKFSIRTHQMENEKSNQQQSQMTAFLPYIPIE